MVFIDGTLPNNVRNRDETTPITLRPIEPKVSPLEVIGSMTGKIGKRIDEGVLGNMVRAYLVEQISTSFGKSGYNFNKKYVENDAMYTSPSRKYYKGSTGLGFFAGVLQDLATVVFVGCYFGGDRSISSESCMAIAGLKVATQVGAYAVRRVKREVEEIKENKINARRDYLKSLDGQACLSPQDRQILAGEKQ